VPREDRTLFALPSLADSLGAVKRNAVVVDAAAIDIQGRDLTHLREWTKREALQAAREYTAVLDAEADHESHAAENTPPAPVRNPQQRTESNNDQHDLPAFITDGHQPSLFHPGVWAKNFAIADIAQRTQRQSLHLVVDNDTLSTSEVAVPCGSREQPKFETVPFDAERTTAPWEDARIGDLETFRSFGFRVTQLMQRWNITPLVEHIWPVAVALAERGASLRDCFTAARRRLEREWGIDNLELPLSRLNERAPFLWFASHLFAHARRFREVHNAVLGEFRRVNRVRSRTHPVPELSRTGEWIEVPFWLWRTGQRLRRPAFVRQNGKEMELTDRHDITISFPLTPDMDACCAVEALKQLPEQGIRLRTRALTTTLFARLCLSDLFVHGIGGAKYDEMTDRIITRFFGISPPEILTLSATIFLPLDEPFNVSESTLQDLRHQLRDMHYNSDRYLTPGENPQADELRALKQRLIEQQQRAASEAQSLSRHERRARFSDNHRRFLQFQDVNHRLRQFTRDQQRQLRQQIDTVQSQLKANGVLQNREFSFCLYPEATLRPFLAGLWQQDAASSASRDA